MSITTMHDGRVVLHQADCRDVLRGLPDNSIDSVVCDPPYALVSIQKRFGKPGSAVAKHGKDGLYARASAGFMGKTWDTGEVAFSEEFWAEVLRVLKPGGHVVAFSGTRTYHRMAVAIEDAGFEIRDQLGWVYGSGFPKSHDVSKGIDKKRDDREDILRVTAFMADAAEAAGISRADVDAHMGTSDMGGWWLSRLQHRCACPTLEQFEMLKALLSLSDEMDAEVSRLNGRKGEHGEAWQAAEVVGVKEGVMAGWSMDGKTKFVDREVKDANSEEARRWRGWGTALKPAWEPICLARKPLCGTVAENVLEHGTGAINVNGCRVYGDLNAEGRWPANICHDGSDEVLAAFPVTKDGVAVKRNLDGRQYNKHQEWGLRARAGDDVSKGEPGATGSAARFFYCAKASRADRDAGLEAFAGKADSAHRKTNVEETGDNPYLLGVTVRKNSHPTVKPTTLMQWLCRLVTPPGGVILDPFMGSGSTGKAAVLEGFQFVGCEREDEYMPIATARIAWAIGASDSAPAVAPAQPAANDNQPADLFAPAQAGAA